MERSGRIVTQRKRRDESRRCKARVPAPPRWTYSVRIGNSRGIRIPKPLIEQCGLGEAVDLRVEDGAPGHRPRRLAAGRVGCGFWRGRREPG